MSRTKLNQIQLTSAIATDVEVSAEVDAHEALPDSTTTKPVYTEVNHGTLRSIL